jgi:hypothetical protein
MRRLHVLLLALPLFTISACAADASQLDAVPSSPPPTPVSSPTPTDREYALQGGLVTYVRPTGNVGGNAAIFGGVLGVVGGCVFVNDSLALFPRDQTSWDGETLTFWDKQYRPGDLLYGSGGEPSMERLPASIQSACPATSAISLLHPRD